MNLELVATEFASQKSKMFLWHSQALYLGIGIASALHQHYALQIGISFGQPFKIRTQRETPYEHYSSFIVLPNQPHEIDAADTPAAFLWLESESLFARSIIQRYTNSQPIQPLPVELIHKLNLILHGVSDAAECQSAEAAFQAFAEAIGNSDWTLPMLDPRVHTVTDLIKQGIAAKNDALIRQMAEKVYLSPSRLRHLFQEQIGLSMQRYILWQRLLTALQAVASGDSLTQAAHSAGFADSAHFTRTFRAMFGMRPSDIFKYSHPIQVIACRP